MKHLTSLLVSTAIILATIPVHLANAAAPTDYISCWDLEESSGTRLDANTTNSNDLSDINTVTSATGINGTGASFAKATSEYLEIINADQTGLNLTGDLSISMWFKMASNPANDSSYQLVNRLQANDGYRLAIFRTLGGVNQLRRGLYNGGVAYNTDITTTLNTATWYHILWTYNSSSNASILYKDGAQISAATSTLDPGSVSSQLRLGSNAETAGQYADGVMDIVEIYNRVLDTPEIATLYNSGTGISCDDRSSAPAEATTTPNIIIQGDISVGGDVVIQ